MCLVIHSKDIYAISQYLHALTTFLRCQEELAVSTKVAQDSEKGNLWLKTLEP